MFNKSYFCFCFLDLSVVSREWLMDCHKRERRLPLKNYLVGKSIAPVDDVEDDDEIVCSQPIHENVNAQGKRPLEGIFSII